MQTDDVITGNGFVDALIAVRDGRTIAEATAKMADLIASIGATGKPGAIRITLAFKPGPDKSIVVTDDVTVVLPKADKGMSVFYITKDHKLSRRHPDQPSLLPELDAPDATTGELRQFPKAVNNGDLSHE